MPAIEVVVAGMARSYSDWRTLNLRALLHLVRNNPEDFWLNIADVHLRHNKRRLHGVFRL